MAVVRGNVPVRRGPRISINPPDPLGMARSVPAQDNGEQQPPARQELQHIHTPQSIDQELAHLTKDLELTRNSKSKCGLCSRNTRTRFRPCSTRIRQLRGKTLLLRSTQLAMKRTARFTRCLQTIRRNWRERCRKLSTTAKKTGDLLRRQQRRRRSYILRPLDEVVLWI